MTVRIRLYNKRDLAEEEETARKVAARRGKPVILRVAAAKMNAAGLVFFRSENGVWLTDAVPAEFLAFP